MRSFALLVLSAAAVLPAFGHSSSKECASGRKHTKFAGKQRLETLDWNSALGQYVEGGKTKAGDDTASVNWQKLSNLYAGQGGQGDGAAPVMETHWVTKWSTQWTYETGGGGKANNAAATSVAAKTTTSAAPRRTTTAAPRRTTTAAAPAAMTSVAAASSGSSDASSALQKTALDMHNDLRAKHGASALTWNTDLVASAQAWGKRCVFEHGGGKSNGAGENLSAYTGGSNVKWGVQMWIDEASQYDYDSPGFTHATGHFTQMVWKDTTELGCAEVSCPSLPVSSSGNTMTNAYFLVCHYLKGGNIVGNDNAFFRLNVLSGSS
ncbi:hypothetical protein JCM11251_004851 [Rhodosporidiobolus azoricus]